MPGGLVSLGMANRPAAQSAGQYRTSDGGPTGAPSRRCNPSRGDVSLGYGNATARLSFRESEGPLFFELADLLLQLAKSASDPKREQELLLEARDTVEHLKTVELEDYFCDECVDVQRVRTRALRL